MIKISKRKQISKPAWPSATFSVPCRSIDSRAFERREKKSDQANIHVFKSIIVYWMHAVPTFLYDRMILLKCILFIASAYAYAFIASYTEKSSCRCPKIKIVKTVGAALG